MKNYIAAIRDVRGDGYLNPAPPETRPVGNIRKIVVHHDAVVRPHDYDSMARYRSEAAGHYNSLGPGLQYHFKIDNTGEIFWLRPFTATLWHASNLDINRTSVAICVDGYFHPPHNQQPTREQLEALKQLLDWLCTQHPEFPASQPDVFAHWEIALPAYPTACPGNILLPHVQQYRLRSKIDIPDGIGYDWPSLQPNVVVPPNMAPPAVPPTPPTVTINYRVIKADKQIGAYTVDTNAWNKYQAEAADKIIDQNGNDVTLVLKAKFEPAKPVEVTPPAGDAEKPKPIPADPTMQDAIVETNTIVKQIRDMVTAILAFLARVFK